MKKCTLLLLLLAYSVANADDEHRGKILFEVGGDSSDIAMLGKRGAELSFFGRPRLEVAAGVIDSETVRRGIVSVGPVWQRRSYLRYGVLVQELSFAPTLLTSGKLSERDLGGVVQFTTGIGIGWIPSEQSQLYIGFRIQHISNGSIHSRNPGMDSAGLEFYWSPASRR